MGSAPPLAPRPAAAGRGPRRRLCGGSRSASGTGRACRPRRSRRIPATRSWPPRATRPRGTILDARGTVLAQNVARGGVQRAHATRSRGRAGRRLLEPDLRRGRPRAHLRPAALGLRRYRARGSPAAQVPGRSDRRPRTCHVARPRLQADAASAGRPARRGRRHRAVDRARPGAGQQPHLRPEQAGRPGDRRCLRRVALRRAGGRLAAAQSRDAGPVHAGLGVQDRDRDRGPRLGSNHARHDLRGPAWRRADRLPGRRLHDRRRPPRRSERPPLDFDEATEVSCNICFAHAGLAIGGRDLRSWARQLGFGDASRSTCPSRQPGDLGDGTPRRLRGRVELANAAYGKGRAS